MKCAEDTVIRVAEENDLEWDQEKILELLYEYIEDGDIDAFEDFLKGKAKSESKDDERDDGRFIRSVDED